MADNNKINSKFGYLDNSVDSPKASFGSSKTAKNIFIDKGNLESNTLDMQSSIEYLQSTTMFDENKTYSIDGDGDLARSDGGKVGANILDYSITLSKEEVETEKNEMFDNFDAFKRHALSIIKDATDIGLLDLTLKVMKKKYIRIIPMVKAEYLDASDNVVGTVWFAITSNTLDYKDTSNDFYSIRNQSLRNLPNYDEILDLLSDKSYPYIDNSGEVFINPLTGGTYFDDTSPADWELQDNGINPKPKGTWAGTLATYSSIAGGFSSIRLTNIKVYGATGLQNDEGAKKYVFNANELLYEYNSDDDSDLYIYDNNDMPDTIELLNSKIEDADVLDELEWIHWSKILEEASGGHGFYLNVNNEEEGFIAGNFNYVFTNYQEIGSPYDYSIESIPSEIYDVKVYEYQLNTATKLVVNIEDTATYDGTDEVWSVDNSNAGTLKIYKQFPTQSIFSLLQELDLQALDKNSSEYEVVAYTDIEKTTEYDKTSWSDGDTYYIDIVIKDTTILSDIVENETLDTYNNYPPNYDLDTEEAIGEIDYVVNYQERIFYSIDGYLYFSQASEPEYFPLNKGAVFSFKSEITGLVVYDELLYIFTKSGIYILYGAENPNLTGWHLKPIDNEITVLSDTAVKCDEYILFVAKGDGIYILQGQQYKKISYPVGTDITDFNTGSAKFIDNRYYLFEHTRATNVDGDISSTAIIFDTRYMGFYENIYEYDGNTSSEVYNETVWQSNDIDFDNREFPKSISQISVEFEGDIDINIYKDGTNTTTYTNLTSTDRQWRRLRIDDIKFNVMNIKFELNTSSSIIYDWQIIRLKTKPVNIERGS